MECLSKNHPGGKKKKKDCSLKEMAELINSKMDKDFEAEALKDKIVHWNAFIEEVMTLVVDTLLVDQNTTTHSIQVTIIEQLCTGKVTPKEIITMTM